MAKIGNLVTGDNSVATFDLSWVPQFILIVGITTANVVKALNIIIDGTTVQSVSGTSLIGAMMKYLQESNNGVIGLMWKISSGFVGGQTCQINLTNSAANTNEVRAFSGRKKGVPYLAGMKPVQINTSVVFSGFTALFFDATNFDFAQITFADGHNERLTAVELAALFNLENQCDANGLLNGIHVIDNKLGNIVKAEIYANAVDTLQVGQLKAYGV
jgi:hypothetical protein